VESDLSSSDGEEYSSDSDSDSGYESRTGRLQVPEVLEILSKKLKDIITVFDIDDMMMRHWITIGVYPKVRMQDRYILSVFGCHMCGELFNDFASVQLHLKSCSVKSGNVKCNLGNTCSKDVLHFHYIGSAQKYVCTKCNLTVQRNLREHTDRH